MESNLTFNQKIESVLMPLVADVPLNREEKSLEHLFSKVQDELKRGMSPDKLKEVGKALDVIAQLESPQGSFFSHLTGLFRSKVGISEEIYPHFIRLCKNYESALSGFQAKKENICKWMGINPKDPLLKLDEVDRDIFFLINHRRVFDCWLEIAENIPGTLPSNSKISIAAKITALDSEPYDRIVSLMGKLKTVNERYFYILIKNFCRYSLEILNFLDQIENIHAFAEALYPIFENPQSPSMDLELLKAFAKVSSDKLADVVKVFVEIQRGLSLFKDPIRVVEVLSKARDLDFSLFLVHSIRQINNNDIDLNISFIEKFQNEKNDKYFGFLQAIDKMVPFFSNGEHKEEEKFLFKAILLLLSKPSENYFVLTSLFEDLLNICILRAPTPEARIEFLEACIENMDQDWNGIVECLNRIEFAEYLKHPKILINNLFDLKNTDFLFYKRHANTFIELLNTMFRSITNENQNDFIINFFQLINRLKIKSFMTLYSLQFQSYPEVSYELKMKIWAACYRNSSEINLVLEGIIIRILKDDPSYEDKIPEIVDYIYRNYTKQEIQNIGIIDSHLKKDGLINVSRILFLIIKESIKRDKNKPINLNNLGVVLQNFRFIEQLYPFTLAATIQRQSNKAESLAFLENELDVLVPIFLRITQDFNGEIQNNIEICRRFIESAFLEINVLLEAGVYEDRGKKLELMKKNLKIINENRGILNEFGLVNLQQTTSLVDAAPAIYEFYDHLKDLINEPVFELFSQFTTEDDFIFYFNPLAFREIFQTKEFLYKDLPPIDPNILGKVFDQMIARFNQMGISNAENYLREHGVISNTIALSELRDNIVSEGKQIYKAAHIGIPVNETEREGVVPAHVAKVFTILAEVMELSDEIAEKEVVSPKEYRVILIANFLRNCPTGQNEGLFQLDLFLDQLRGSSKDCSYIESMPSPNTSALEVEERVVNRERFIQNNLKSVFSVQTAVFNDLISNNLGFINELISDRSFLSTPFNRKEALRLYFTQVVHQTCYLKNLLGKTLGFSQTLAFDPYIEWINPNLKKKTKNEVLEIFCKYYGPIFLDAVQAHLNELLDKNYSQIFSQINSFIPEVTDSMWSEDYKKITREGVAALLKSLNILSYLNIFS